MSSKPGAHGTDLTELAKQLLKHGPHKVESTSRRVRVVHNHTVILDTTKAAHVWEHPYYPQFYFPAGELQNCSVAERKPVNDSDGQHGASILELAVGGKDGVEELRNDRVIHFEDKGRLAGLIRIEFGSVDQWLEEDTPIYVHPKDPYKRVDILPSSRPVEVKIDGRVVANSPNSAHLLETLLPTRYYLPLACVDQSVLRKSSTITRCPYKGDAEYYDVIIDGNTHKDIAWYYRLPTHESAMIAGLVCFYNEKVDIILDGKQLERPRTVFA